LRIALISPFPPLKGGIARFSDRLTAAFEEVGCQVVRVPFLRLYPDWLLKGRSSFEPGHAAVAESPYRLDLMNPLSWLTTARSIRRLSPDVLLVAYWTGLLAPLCVVLRAVTGIRTYVLLHNFTSHETLPAEPLLQRLLVASVDGFVALSGTVRRELESRGGGKPALTLFHPLYEPHGPIPTKRDARRLLGLSVESKVLLFFGYIRRYKGLEVLLEAMASASRQDPSLKLVVAGEFIGDEASFRALAEQLGISGCIDFRPGYVPAEEVGSLFAAADAVVLPYQSATQSGVVPLAFGHGVPVIVCAAGELSSQVAHGSNGWVVDQAGPEALAEGILAFFAKREEMPLREGMEEARKAISWTVFAEAAAAFMETETGRRG
jgi:glycosyltransferase involved in cell wall biosynthesis